VVRGRPDHGGLQPGLVLGNPEAEIRREAAEHALGEVEDLVGGCMVAGAGRSVVGWIVRYDVHGVCLVGELSGRVRAGGDASLRKRTGTKRDTWPPYI